eukprot:scaffold137398_cov39-Tisochrysis_lutea.AAC.4
MASSTLLTLRGIDYRLALSADDGALRLDLQEAQTGALWSGTFNTRCELRSQWCRARPRVRTQACDLCPHPLPRLRPAPELQLTDARAPAPLQP